MTRISCASCASCVPSPLLLFRRVLVEGFFDHVIQLAFKLGRVALFFSCDPAPDEGSCAGIPQIDNEATFGIWNFDDTGTEATPSRGISLDFGFACGAEPVLDIQVG